MNFGEIANQSGNRVYPNEQRRNGSGLPDVRPLAKQQQRSEKYSPSSSSQPRKKSQTCSDTYRRCSRRRERLWRVASAKQKSRRGKQQNNSDQNSEDRRRRLQVTAEISSRNGKQRKWPEKFPRKMTGAPELKRANGRNQNVKHKRSRPNDCGRDSEKRHGCDVTRRARMAHGRVKKCDQANCKKQKNELRRVQVVRHSSLIRHSTFVLRHLLSRFLDFARNDKNGAVSPLGRSIR